MRNKLLNLNYFISEKYIDIVRYTPYIQVFLFHKIFKDRSEIIPENGAPLEAIDLNQFETILNFFYKRKVQFINENDILSGRLNPNEQYIYLTFDDGYYNNFLCLDLLEKYNAKATFMISTKHIEQNKSFWWDALYRELRIKGNLRYTNRDINKKTLELHGLKWFDQEQYIVDNFGHSALVPKNDVDRPMTPDELKLFSSHPCITLGNHTHNHLNMTLYDEKELIESITIAEEFLNRISTQNISSISYPYGYYNDECVKIVNDLNYKIGITINKGLNYFDVIEQQQTLLRLNRNEFSGEMDIIQQCRKFHTNFSLYSAIKNLKW